MGCSTVVGLGASKIQCNFECNPLEKGDEAVDALLLIII